MLTITPQTVFEWQRKGRPIVIGKIYNNWGFAAANMRLLVDELVHDRQALEGVLAVKDAGLVEVL